NVSSDLSPHAVYPRLSFESLENQYRDFLSSYSGASLGESGVIFTRGALEGLEFLVRAFCEPGCDQVATTSPAFPEYQRLAKVNGNTVENYPLSGANFDILPLAAIEQSKAKLLFLCNPNNPVGSIFEREQLEVVLESFRGLVVVDEVYAELAGP